MESIQDQKMKKQSKNSILSQKEIGLLLPQKPPFVLVDALFFCNTNKSITGFMVPEKHILVHNNFLSEAGLLENMAQSIALKSAYIAKKENFDLPKIGYIASIKTAEIKQLPPVFSSIKTQVNLTHEFGQLSRYKVVVENKQGEVLAKAQINTALDSE